jgi:hypothetical protein
MSLQQLANERTRTRVGYLRNAPVLFAAFEIFTSEARPCLILGSPDTFSTLHMKTLVYLVLPAPSSALLGVSGAGGTSSVGCGSRGAVAGTAASLTIFVLSSASGSVQEAAA